MSGEGVKGRKEKILLIHITEPLYAKKKGTCLSIQEPIGELKSCSCLSRHLDEADRRVLLLCIRFSSVVSTAQPPESQQPLPLQKSVSNLQKPTAAPSQEVQKKFIVFNTQNYYTVLSLSFNGSVVLNIVIDA